MTAEAAEMILHVILGPARCRACDALVVYGHVEHMRGASSRVRRWRDPATYRIHVCKREE